MFGFSFSKILFTIVMIAVVWWVYRQINLMTDGSNKPRVKTKNDAGRNSQREADPNAASTVEDLSACPACGAYVAAGSNPGCGRAAKDCPMQA